MKDGTSLATRVAIVDDHRMVCAGVASLIKCDPRFVVVSEVYNSEDAAALLGRNDIDIVLLDLEMPGKHGVELLREFNGRLAICILSIHTDAHFVFEAIKAGALGYVSKSTAPSELMHGLLTMSRGEPFFSSDIQKIALSFAAAARDNKMTNREQEVLRFCAQGLSSVEVASRLKICRRTAEAHRANLMKKLALKTQTDLVRYALRNDIIAS